jgi:uncharacterized membrane protein
MFKMIGGDGQEYGPVTAEQLRQWILDHRANGQTLVQAEGEADWKPLSARPEFTEALAAAARLHDWPDPAQAATAAGTAGLDTAGRAVELRVFDCLGRGWALLQRHVFLIMGASLLVWSVQTFLALFGLFGLLASWLVSGALYGGLCVLVLKLARGQPAALGDVFACFDARFLSCMLVWLFTEIMTQIGLALLLVPGIFFGVVWAFSLPLAADRGLDLGPALAVSWRTVLPRFFPLLGLLALAFLPVVVFAAYSLVVTTGIALRTLGPAGATTLGEMFNQLLEVVREAAVLGFQQHLVLLLNLPFAWAAVMTAYEDLFNPGRRPAA